MTSALETLLKDMQNAMGARALYPADHPRTREGIERIERQVRELTLLRPEISVFALEDKLVHEGSVLSGSESLARGLFRTLRTCGYDRLTIRRDVTREELDEFLAALAETAKRADGTFRERMKPSANIRLASFRAADIQENTAPLTEDDFLAEEVQVLGGVWNGVVQQRSLDLNAVEGIVIALSKTVEENLGAMIPMATLKSWDEYTGAHIINVALLAMALSESLGMPRKTVHDVGIAALLHDIGKLQVSSEILNKPDRLTPREFDAIKRHPEDGARILSATPGAPELAVIVAFEHHVRFDGAGYPRVPRPWKLNLASGITQVADIYDALRCDRPYRRSLDRDVIVRMMMADSGTHFDPELLSAFFDRVIPRTQAVG